MPYRERVAFLTMATFLEPNGRVFGATEPEVVQVMLRHDASHSSSGSPLSPERTHVPPLNVNVAMSLSRNSVSVGFRELPLPCLTSAIS